MLRTAHRIECVVARFILQSAITMSLPQSKAFLHPACWLSETGLLSQAFFAKIAQGLAKRKNSPYVSPRDANAAFHMRL